MIMLLMFLWVFIQLQAPTWCFVALGACMALKVFIGIIDIIKAIVDAYDNRKKK